MWGAWVRSLVEEDPLEREMATNSSILAWKTPGMEKPGGLQSMGSQRLRHNWNDFTFTFFDLTVSSIEWLLSIVTPLWYPLLVNICYFFFPFFFFFFCFCGSETSLVKMLFPKEDYFFLNAWTSQPHIRVTFLIYTEI